MSSMKSGSVTILFTAIVLTLACMPGCTDTPSTSSASATSDAAVQVAESEPESSRDSGKYGAPVWFVDEFPVHPDLSLSRKKSDEPENFSFVFEGSANRADEMRDWFKTHLNKDGWKISKDPENRGGMYAEKAGGFQMHVRVTGIKNVTTIVMIDGAIKP